MINDSGLCEAEAEVRELCLLSCELLLDSYTVHTKFPHTVLSTSRSSPNSISPIRLNSITKSQAPSTCARLLFGTADKVPHVHLSNSLPCQGNAHHR